ncbi:MULTISPECIES: hypothetical protein [Cobetia]|uniref:Uncharacterized protein n=1 Tax=Cobetia crustatorum TaxID=553385 RepID=A0A558HGS2_9GAMM|nr:MULTISPECIES: hypothetical protein [Cobetia]TVU68330.1 hypothetical protein FQP86_14115 [Cobetia crustatorum]
MTSVSATADSHLYGSERDAGFLTYTAANALRMLEFLSHDDHSFNYADIGDLDIARLRRFASGQTAPDIAVRDSCVMNHQLSDRAR